MSPKRYYTDILESILKYVTDNPGSTTNEISLMCNVAWLTGESYLARLVEVGKLEYRLLGKRTKKYTVASKKEDA